MKQIAVTILALAGAGILGACGTGKVGESEVEQQVKTALTQKVGQAPDSIDCPGDLTGKVGEKMRCVLTDGATKYGVTVTVTSVTDDKALFDAVVDEEPMTSTTEK